jgi:light-regulated signal transduction histidine kinase (bacteriophytochrome)
LRVITGFLDLLDRRYHQSLNAEAAEFLDLVLDGASRMKKQIDALLNLSQLGVAAPALRPVQSGEILQMAVANLGETIRERSAQITWDSMPEIFADSVLLGEVFQNLIASGIKFNKGTTPSVHISVEKQDSDWVFSVRDNGIGIEAQQADRVFGVFERLHAASEFPGTGVGLTIIQKIVKLHKGRVWFESKPGEGTTFFFTIPRVAGKAIPHTVGK